MLKEKIYENSTLANNDKGKSEVATSSTMTFFIPSSSNMSIVRDLNATQSY